VIDLKSSSDEGSSQTLTIQAYGKLRDMIISNELVPGQRLKVELLRDLIAVGATPIREALSLLTSDGLVERLDKRGFRVSEVSLAEYDDLHSTRCLLEEHALRQSIQHSDQSWEERLVLVTHRLRRVPRTIAGPEGAVRSNPEWERTHKLFHMTLLSSAPSKTLLQFCDQLHDRLNRYRSFAAVGASAPRDWKSEHDLIAEAAIDHEADLAVSRLMDHYSRTTGILKKTLAEMHAG
jgi:DNA-binding GntR family transcriptional regulator